MATFKAADATPDQFTFADQNGVALSTLVTSNTITVSGIDSAVAISITGGEYSINGGVYTSGAGTANNGNTVTVRQTSSASFSTTTDTVLTIGGVSDTFSVTTLVAETTVVSTFQINNGAAETTSRTVTLNNTATDSPTHYKASESSDFTNATWQPYAEAPNFTLSTVDGTKTVYFKVQNANDESAVVNDSITLKELPVVTTFQINSGAAETTIPTVTLNNTATGSPTEYMASELTSFADTTWQTYSTAPSFTLSIGDGAKTVYFKVRNVNGVSATISDAITLDTTAPTVSLNAVTSPTKVTSQVITGTVEAGATVGVATSTAASDGPATVTGTTWSYTITGLVEGANGITVTAIDKAGNTATANGSITLDTTAPTVSSTSPARNATGVALDGAIVATFSETMNSSTITTSTFTVNNGTSNISGTVSYSGTTATFTLTSSLTSYTTYTVTITMGVTDEAGNAMVANYTWSFTTVDTTAPSGTVTINSNATYTNSTDVTLNLTATDGVGVTGYYASETSTTPSSGAGGWTAVAMTTSYSANVPFTLSSSYGEKTVYVWYKDAAGNVSSAAIDTITLKDDLPVVTMFQINNGAAETTSRKVKLNNTATGSPTHYSASESSIFTKWKKYASAPPFKLSPGVGEKTVHFKVKNAKGESLVVSDSITLKKARAATVADAGIDQLARRGSVVTLDGSRSFSPEENVPLTYEWSFISLPSGMGSLLFDPKSVNPTFTLKRQGRCEIKLIVKDSLGIASEPDTVIISTKDTAPVANAGDDQSINEVGTWVMLNGAQSYDPDGDVLAYQWAFISRPAESVASLEDATTARPTFMADAPGDYVIQLTVNDSQTHSSSDTVVVSFGNVRPVANAGKSLAVKVGDTVTLAGDGTDANGDVLSFRWILSSYPDGSQSELADSSARVTSFTPDRAGAYVAQLVVSDGELDSEPGTIQIQAFTVQTGAIIALQGLETEIAELDSGAFKNGDMQNLLLNKLNAVIANVEAGKYADAANQLRNDILPKMGSVENAEGDKGAWIVGSRSQWILYREVQDAMKALEMAR